MHGALITIFTDLYDRARSNVLSNAYLTVHRIGHTRDTAIACYWTLSQHLGNRATRYILLAAACTRNLLLFLIDPRPDFPLPRFSLARPPSASPFPTESFASRTCILPFLIRPNYETFHRRQFSNFPRVSSLHAFTREVASYFRPARSNLFRASIKVRVLNIPFSTVYPQYLWEMIQV